MKCVYPLIDRQFSYVRLAASLLNLAGITTELSGVITTQFCFTYTLETESVTAMPSGLHARLCRAFLVMILLLARQHIV